MVAGKRLYMEMFLSPESSRPNFRKNIDFLNFREDELNIFASIT